MRKILDVYNRKINEVEIIDPYHKDDKIRNTVVSRKEKLLLDSTSIGKISLYDIKHITDVGKEILGLELNSVIVGYFSYTEDSILRNMYQVAVEYDIHINPEYETKGIGELLVSAVLQETGHYLLSNENHTPDNITLWKNLFKDKKYHFYLYYSKDDKIFTTNNPLDYWDKGTSGYIRILLSETQFSNIREVPDSVLQEK